MRLNYKDPLLSYDLSYYRKTLIFFKLKKKNQEI